VSADATASAPDRFIARQRRLLALLACPRCHGSLDLLSPTTVRGAVAEADLACLQDGRVGVIHRFMPSFLDRELNAHAPGRPDPLVPVALDLGPVVAAAGDEWETVDQGYRCADRGELAFQADGAALDVTFFGHDWSGIVAIEVAGDVVLEHDLYRAEAAAVVLSAPLPGHPATVRIVATGKQGPDAFAAQVVLESIDILVPAARAEVPSVVAVNRGNPYPPRFGELLAAVPAAGAVLDCGGGDRRYGDDRVFNLEYMEYRLPDLLGDGLALPFADACFDLVLSQAVLEHVPDPQRAVDEIVRVLKPGGTAYVEAAFMQPLHAVPSHYMNITPFGLDHLCVALDRRDGGVFGGLDDTFAWFARVIDADRKLDADRLASVRRTLQDLDAAMSPAELRMVASAVWFEGLKPGSD
jgi:uncharacterized protein YbaR (Trm112 family)